MTRIDSSVSHDACLDSPFSPTPIGSSGAGAAPTSLANEDVRIGGVQLLLQNNPPSQLRQVLAILQSGGEPVESGSSRTSASRSTALASARQIEIEIRSSAEYQHLPDADRRSVDQIIARADSRPVEARLYYLGKLQRLLDTPYSGADGGSVSLAERTQSGVDSAVSAQRTKQNDWQGLEELLSGMGLPSVRRGEGGTLYRVTQDNPDLIVVQLKVRVSGDPEFVGKVTEIEDAIEKAASATGYHVDLVFTDESGPDVFEVNADPKQWPNSRNWAGDPQTLAHELHHLLGLNDRYDYIESHATNADMTISDRLYWFAEQMKRPHDPRASASLMGDQWIGSMLSEDVCAVAQGDVKACVLERKELDPTGIPELPVHLRVH